MQVGVAAKEISDGVEDLIAIVLRGKGVHPILKSVFGRKHLMKLIEAPEDIKEFTIGKLNIPEEIDIEYIRRDDNIIFDTFDKFFKINPKDIILVSGSPAKIKNFSYNFNKISHEK